MFGGISANMIECTAGIVGPMTAQEGKASSPVSFRRFRATNGSKFVLLRKSSSCQFRSFMGVRLPFGDASGMIVLALLLGRYSSGR